MFPNPSEGVSTLIFENENRGELNIKVYDLQGKLVWEQAKVDFEGYYQEEINLTNSPSGIYLVKMTLNGEQYTEEMVITNK